MSGYGLLASDCKTIKVTNSSFYHSVICAKFFGGGAGIVSNGDYFHNCVPNYTMELSFSNFTKCCSSQSGGGINLITAFRSNVPVKIAFRHLIVPHNRAKTNGGCLSVNLRGRGKISLEISNSIVLLLFCSQYSWWCFVTIVWNSNFNYSEHKLC